MIDWDAMVLGPVMAVFGESDPLDPTNMASWPTYMPASGAPSFKLADAVFDSQSGSVEPEGEISLSTVRTPVIGVRLALFGGVDPVQDDRVYVPSAAAVFMVSDVRPDGHGWAKLVLMNAKDQSVR